MIHDHGEIAEPEADHGFPEVAFKALFILRTQSCGSFGKRLGYLAAQLFNCC